MTKELKSSSDKKSHRLSIFNLYAVPVILAILVWYYFNSQIFYQYKTNNQVPVIKSQRPLPSESSIIEPVVLLDFNQASMLYREVFNDFEALHVTEILAIEDLMSRNEIKKATRLMAELARKLPVVQSPRCLYLSARLLELAADSEQSQNKLRQSVQLYKKLVSLNNTADSNILYAGGVRLLERLIQLGSVNDLARYCVHLLSIFPDNIYLMNQLGHGYLLANRPKLAQQQFERVLHFNASDAFATCHLAFILKQIESNVDDSVEMFKRCLLSNEKRVMDARFFYHLGDALQRSNRTEEAYQYYQLAVKNGVFSSVYQRSIYNVDGLRSKPFWSTEETTYSRYFKLLEDNWQLIRDEAEKQLDERKSLFIHEEENLRHTGEWRQLTLYQRGARLDKNCRKTPITCNLVEQFAAARGCTRGQVKFSVMSEDTHVWPHCGPTNSRLRAHLALRLPKAHDHMLARLRVANETRSWVEGKFLIFDDSFEHEVWYDKSQQQEEKQVNRLLLIVDIWHPDLTEKQRSSLVPI